MDNPLLDRLLEVQSAPIVGLDEILDHEPGWSIAFHQARDRCIFEYGFGVPDDEALRLVAEYAPIVEIGAGTGYWAAQLRDRDVDVHAYDAGVEDRWNQRHYPVERRDHRVVEEYSNRALLIVWPSYTGGWAREALDLYRGDTVIYVGEHRGGCCATDEFFDALERDWFVAVDYAIPQWWGLHDALWIYRRKEKTDEA
jgi:hypothetical protein